ncbi:molybdenum cofactor guanylyltransferase MobA [Pseudomonas sp. 2FG]|uniref:molybdenum cofactor guanylyltransferase MobA n=1 Tax=Pseudomonas sp. 2FG TaxID=2502191 RepID=UPI0010F4FF79|nr:molybdenum cofactor guanylyltransferase MobA [Pseudomonas sp. 2FG]
MTDSLALPACSILLLAGGRGQRMGGRDKGLLDWRGKPLIAHLHALTRPLTDDLIISCNRNGERYAAYADRLVQDDSLDFPGPLAGIRAGLAVARQPFLLVLPCDAPLLDLALLQAMRETAAAQPEKPLMLRQGGQWEPLFCLLPRTLAPAVENAWQAGDRGPRHVLLALGAVALDCPAQDPRLANLNTPELLAQAASYRG